MIRQLPLGFSFPWFHSRATSFAFGVSAFCGTGSQKAQPILIYGHLLKQLCGVTQPVILMRLLV